MLKSCALKMAKIEHHRGASLGENFYVVKITPAYYVLTTSCVAISVLAAAIHSIDVPRVISQTSF